MRQSVFCAVAALLLGGCSVSTQDDGATTIKDEATSQASVPPSGNSTFAPFHQETTQLGAAVQCENPLITEDGLPALWSCIEGPSETVKLFVNKAEQGEDVSNVKLMWNDWTSDIGYGLHADQQLAEKWLRIVANRYAPKDAESLILAFRGNENRAFSNAKFDLKYEYYQGPKIAERLLIITSR